MEATHKMTKHNYNKVDSITDKGSSKLNEDTFVINNKNNLFAVFDGAGSLTPFNDKDGRTGAFLASNIAKEVFENSDKEDLVKLAFGANLKISEAMIKHGIDISDKLNLWATSVAAVKIKDNSFDWIQVSDTLILVIYKDKRYKLLVNDYDHDRETLMLMKRLSEQGVENPRAAITKPLEELRRQLNISYGFLAGEKNIKFLHSGTESLSEVRNILIFSDGLLIPKSDPNENDDIDKIVREFYKSGLKGWLEYVRAIEKNDPLLKKYARYKQYDDATAIAIYF